MPNDRISCFIRRLCQHGDLGHQSIEAVHALPWRLIKRSKNSYVLRDGDRPGEVSILISGFAQRLKTTSEGTRQIVAFSVPGDPLDFECLFLEEADFSVQLCSNGTIACVRKDAVRTLFETKPDFARAVTSALLADAAKAREWVMNVGRRDARQRIAHLLCEIMARLRAQDMKTEPFELPFTQEQLADATGLTPVHVNRILKQLSTEGAIRRTGRFISVPNWDRLQDIGDFDDRFLHMDLTKRSMV